MTCTPMRLNDGKGGVIVGIVCGRSKRKRKKCLTCRQFDAEFECDGCDAGLCRGCTVSPEDNVDFCAKCHVPVWKQWLNLRTTFVLASPDVQREERRRLFREWARQNPREFDVIARAS